MNDFHEQYQLALKKLGLRLDENIKERNYIENRIREVIESIKEVKRGYQERT